MVVVVAVAVAVAVVVVISSLLQQPGLKKFKLSKVELVYKAKKLKVPLFTIQVKPTCRVSWGTKG